MKVADANTDDKVSKAEFEKAKADGKLRKHKHEDKRNASA